MSDMSSRPSTWYEEERSRILYTCEEKYDGNMIMLVMHLENELKKVQAERDALMKIVHDEIQCGECIHIVEPHDNPLCKDCGILAKNWVWRGIQEQKGGNSL